MSHIQKIHTTLRYQIYYQGVKALLAGYYFSVVGSHEDIAAPEKRPGTC